MDWPFSTSCQLSGWPGTTPRESRKSRKQALRSLEFQKEKSSYFLEAIYTDVRPQFWSLPRDYEAVFHFESFVEENCRWEAVLLLDPKSPRFFKFPLISAWEPNRVFLAYLVSPIFYHRIPKEASCTSNILSGISSAWPTSSLGTHSTVHVTTNTFHHNSCLLSVTLWQQFSHCPSSSYEPLPWYQPAMPTPKAEAISFWHHPFLDTDFVLVVA